MITAVVVFLWIAFIAEGIAAFYLSRSLHAWKRSSEAWEQACDISRDYAASLERELAELREAKP